MNKHYTLKPISDSSWILFDDTSRIGLVSQTNDTISIIGSFSPKKFSSYQEFLSVFSGRITVEERILEVREEIANNINGYPIKHATYANVIMDPYPTYTKAMHTKGRYAAGFWALKFQQGWTSAFCPKSSTLADNEHIGPFTTKLELMHQISQKNKEIIL